jgi:DNA-binding transcriptional LysR family regulator
LHWPFKAAKIFQLKIPNKATFAIDNMGICTQLCAYALFWEKVAGANMELRHLRYFVAVAQHLNYSEAARRLHVAQAALSQTIFDVERELGLQLLIRSRRSVKLTAAGETFLGHCNDILQRADEAKRLTQKSALGEVGILRIGYLGPATFKVLPGLVQTYMRKYPKVDIRLFQMNPDEQYAAFDDNRIDVGFSHMLPRERKAGFQEEQLSPDRLLIALPTDHPLTKLKIVKLEKVATEPFVQFHRTGEPCVYDEIIALCRKAGFSARVVQETPLLTGALTLVGSGLGVSIVPGCAMDLNYPNVVFRQIEPAFNTVPLCVAWPRSVKSAVLDAFLDIVRAAKSSIQKQLKAKL